MRLYDYTFALLNRRLYNPEIAFGDFSDIKGDLSVQRNRYLSAFTDADL